MEKYNSESSFHGIIFIRTVFYLYFTELHASKFRSIASTMKDKTMRFSGYKKISMAIVKSQGPGAAMDRKLHNLKFLNFKT